MTETLRYLRLEIDGLLGVLEGQTSVLITHVQILERIQQLFFNWFAVVRPGLVSIGVPTEVLDASDEVFKRLVQLTAGRSRRVDYLRVLRSLKRSVLKGLLLEVARVNPASQTASSTQSARLIPEIPDIRNEFIPNALFGWIPRMRDFLRRYSFDRNVFIMVAYRPRLSRLIKRLKATLVDLELEAIVAQEHSLTDDLFNPIACLLCCNYGIAVFDRPEARQVHNPNVVYELGMMQLLKRPSLILKHRALRTMPSDLLSRLYESYQSEEEAVKRVRDWWSRLTSR